MFPHPPDDHLVLEQVLIPDMTSLFETFCDYRYRQKQPIGNLTAGSSVMVEKDFKKIKLQKKKGSSLD